MCCQMRYNTPLLTRTGTRAAMASGMPNTPPLVTD